MNTSKEKAKEKLAEIEKEAEKLREIINAKDDITGKIKTFADACIAIGISETDFNEMTRTYCKDTIAYEKLKIIIRALNEGWTPDWSDTNERKWYPYFNAASFGFDGAVYDNWSANSCAGSRLCLKSRELAEYAGTQFVDIYKDFMIIGKIIITF